MRENRFIVLVFSVVPSLAPERQLNGFAKNIIHVKYQDFLDENVNISELYKNFPWKIKI